FLVWPFTSPQMTAGLAPKVAEVTARHAERIVYLSAQAAADQPGSFWALVERAIEESGVAWTFLRPTGFAANTLMWADQIRSGGRSAPQPERRSMNGTSPPSRCAR